MSDARIALTNPGGQGYQESVGTNLWFEENEDLEVRQRLNPEPGEVSIQGSAETNLWVDESYELDRNSELAGTNIWIEEEELLTMPSGSLSTNPPSIGEN